MIPLDPAFRYVPLAHRALHDVTDGRPENSRAAVRAAIAAGYGIEIDLQLSRDGQAMVFHDYDLARLTGASGPVQARTAEELDGLPLIGGDEGVPALSEVLALVAGRVPLLIELKDQQGEMGPTDGRLERSVAQALHGYEGAVGLMSFNPHSVIAMAGLCPDIPRGIVTSAFVPQFWPELPELVRARLRGIPDYDAAQASFISHEVHDLKNPRVARLKEGGATILCWTVRSARQEAIARRIADNITFEGYLAAIAA